MELNLIPTRNHLKYQYNQNCVLIPESLKELRPPEYGNNENDL